MQQFHFLKKLSDRVSLCSAAPTKQLSSLSSDPSSLVCSIIRWYNWMELNRLKQSGLVNSESDAIQATDTIVGTYIHVLKQQSSVPTLGRSH